MKGELAGSGGLARALQADHHHHRRTAHQSQADFTAAKELLQLVADDLGHLLRR